MKEYVRPVVLENEDLAEGVYAASGDRCYEVTVNIHQKPETGRGNYRMQLNATHNAEDQHHSTAQRLTRVFNLPVEVVSCDQSEVSGSGTNTLNISYSYHNNPSENIGLGNLTVVADAGLAVTSAKLWCNETCNQH